MAKIIGVHTPSEIKNYAINGAMEISQEKVSTVTTVNTATTTSGYSVDMILIKSQGTTVKNYSYARVADSPTRAESGFNSTYCHSFTQLTGISSFAASDAETPFQYIMEGTDFSNIHGKIVTFGFWVKSTIPGIFTFSIRNSALNRSYVTTYTINLANTWEFKSITVQMDTSGTWTFDNLAGMYVNNASYAGSSFQTSTLNQWQDGSFTTASTATNWAATANNTLRFTMFSIVEGSMGFGPKGFERAGKTFQQEVALCQRYYEKSHDLETTLTTATAAGAVYFASANGNGGGTCVNFPFKIAKRIIPTTVNIYSTGTGAIGNMRNVSLGADITASSAALGTSSSGASNTAATTTGHVIQFNWTADSRF